jgi:F-type H+-transporting ATPase subunit delta
MSARTWALALIQAGNAGGDFLAVAESRCRMVEALAGALEREKGIRDLLRDPGVPLSATTAAMDSALSSAGADAETARLVGLLVRKRALGSVAPLAQRTRREIDAIRGIVRAKVDSATELPSGERTRLEDALAAKLGANKVIAAYRVLPELIGGVRASAGAYTWDDSIRGRLARIKSSISIPVVSGKDH